MLGFYDNCISTLLVYANNIVDGVATGLARRQTPISKLKSVLTTKTGWINKWGNANNIDSGLLPSSKASKNNTLFSQFGVPSCLYDTRNGDNLCNCFCKHGESRPLMRHHFSVIFGKLSSHHAHKWMLCPSASAHCTYLDHSWSQFLVHGKCNTLQMEPSKCIQ